MDTSLGIIIHLLVLLHGCRAEYGDRIKNATVTWGDNLDMEESRHSAFAVAPPGPRTELPVTFQAPYINAKDYWGDSARRTVLDYQQYVPQDLFARPINDGINTFYDMMQHFFGPEEPPRRSPNYQQPYRQQQYDYEFPYYHPPPAKPYYLPGPKPLRASVQKLESPRPHFNYPTTPKNYPHFVKILNDVLIENAFQYQEPPVLEKPEYGFEPIKPTTYRPTGSYRNKFRTTPPSFPGSIQDQLPPVKQGQDTKIPYITETTTRRHTTTPTTGTRVVFPVQTESVPPLDFAIDVRNAHSSAAKRPLPLAVATTTTSPVDKQTYHTTMATIKDVEVTTNGESGLTTKLPIKEFQDVKIAEVSTKNEAIFTASTLVSTEAISEGNQQPATSEEASEVTEETTPESVITESPVPTATFATTPELITSTESATQSPLQTQPSEVRPVVSELLHTMERLKHNRFNAPFPKKLHSRKVTTDSTASADYVTDLTLKGLTDTNAVHASVSMYSNNINMTSVIGYVINQFNATAPPPNVYPLDDALSLDAKILKDTNWDGFQPVIPTTDRAFETTTVWQTTPVTTPSPPTTTEESVALTTMETIPPTTTTEAPASSTERRTVVIATRMTQSVSRLSNPTYQRRTSTEEPYPTVFTTTEYSQRSRTHQTPFIRRRVTTTEQPVTASDTTDFTTESYIPVTTPTWRERTYHRPSQRTRTTTEDPSITTDSVSFNDFTTEIPTTPSEYTRTERTNNWSSRVTEESTVIPSKSENPQEADFPTETPTTMLPSRGRKYHRKPPVRVFPKFQERVTEATLATISSTQIPQHQDNAPVPQLASGTLTTESTRRGRKYQRRPPANSFSKLQEQKSTEPPLRLGTLSRPFYPTRSRPNVTLTFGNRASKRVDDSEERRPERVKTKEEVKARRNLYRRRMYPSQLRRATTEDTIAPEES